MANSAGIAQRLGRAALDLVFPPRCISCRADGAFLCESCAASLPPAEPPRCASCWQPSRPAICPACDLAPPAYDGLRAAFVYAGVARELVHGLKFRGMTALAGPMAEQLAVAAWRYGLVADAIVPVPLSGRRRRTRGYNQAEVLATALGRELSVPVRPQALKRLRHTSPQARSADAGERARNVEGAFVGQEREVAGRRILLVDDVATTGATTSACAVALKAAGAGSVWVLAFARED